MYEGNDRLTEEAGERVRKSRKAKDSLTRQNIWECVYVCVCECMWCDFGGERRRRREGNKRRQREKTYMYNDYLKA